MRPCKSHFVTSCQQLLALGVVLAVLTPAASVISLDVIHRDPADRAAAAAAGGGAELHRPARDRQEVSAVPDAPVEPTVTEVPLTAPAKPEVRTPGPRATRLPIEVATRREVVSRPQPVTGYGAVGVTWSPDEQVEDDEIRLQVRTSTEGRWSGWTDLEYHDEHAPDPTSAEGRDARPGTDPLLIGEAELVQTRVVGTRGLPGDMSLAVVAPGEARGVAQQRPSVAGEESADPDEDGLALRAATTTPPRPTIYSRRQWGADEDMRDGSPSYGTISAGFVHHTVNGNDYTRAEVPGIIRSIYAYHTRSRGWSDIGYNFLVDKFGRIWEGRFGGVARAVVGAHTLGYNDDSFAMSAIGNFDTVQPPEVMLEAYGSLFAWKLGLHGIDPLDSSQNVSGTTFKAINGHRDAGSTACPGRYLYARLPAIRRYAAEAGEDSGPPEVVLGQVDSDLVGTPYPDVVVRRASDGRGMILPTGGLAAFVGPAVVDGSDWSGRRLLATPDVSGDDRVDLLTFDDAGSLEIRPGLAAGGFAEVSRRVRALREHALVTAVGDLDGDGHADLVARGGGVLVSFLGNARGGFRGVPGTSSARVYRQLVAAGDVTGDGHPDLWGRDRRNRWFLHPGLGDGGFAARTMLPGDWSDLTWVTGGIDYTEDTLPDVVARRTDGSLVILPSRSDGTLGRPQGPVLRQAGLGTISGAGQLAGDPAPDLVAIDERGALVVLRNRGTFDVGRPIDTGQSFARGNLLLNAGDMDGDGHGDVVLRRRTGSLWLYRGNGAGRLAAPVSIGGKRTFRPVSGLRVVPDVTGDQRPDMVGRTAEGQATVWPGNGAERLSEGYDVVLTGAKGAPKGVASYDWVVEVSDLRRRGAGDLVGRDGSGDLYRLDGRPRGYRAPRYLGQAGGYDLAG